MSKQAFEAIRQVIDWNSDDLTSPERQVLISMLAGEDVTQILPQRKAPTSTPTEELAPGVTIQDVLRWVEKWDQVKRAPTHIQAISYILHDEVGVPPNGSKKHWIAACHDVWEQSGQNMLLIQLGCRAAKQARDEQGIIISHIRSVGSFVANERGKHNANAKQTPLVF